MGSCPAPRSPHSFSGCYEKSVSCTVSCLLRTRSNGGQWTYSYFATPKFLVQPYDSNIITIFSNFARLQRDQQLNILNQARHRDSESERRLYHLIRSDIPQFNERIDPRDFYRVFFVEPRRSSERIRAQSGAFLLSAFHERFETEEILKRIEDIPIYEHFMLTIANDSRLNIVEELRELNISHELLFPGLDSSARAIAQHYL